MGHTHILFNVPRNIYEYEYHYKCGSDLGGYTRIFKKKASISEGLP